MSVFNLLLSNESLFEFENNTTINNFKNIKLDHQDITLEAVTITNLVSASTTKKSVNNSCIDTLISCHDFWTRCFILFMVSALHRDSKSRSAIRILLLDSGLLWGHILWRAMVVWVWQLANLWTGKCAVKRDGQETGSKEYDLSWTCFPGQCY